MVNRIINFLPPFWLGLLVTLSLLWPLFTTAYFTHHDDVQIIRLFEMNKCIKDLQIPCRWVPDLGGLYGYPLFNYYAPLPYYIGELFYLINGSLILSVKFMFGISFVGAYIFMYLLGRKAWGEAGGVLSGVFYSFAPYHAVAFYVRGAMGEMWGLMLFPALLWTTLRLYHSVKIVNMLILALILAFLILSHNISTMMFLPVFLIFIVILFFQRADLSFLKFLLVSIVLGLMLSAFYWIPMTFEKDLAHVETTTGGYFSYTEHFKGLRKLFLERSWGWGASVREVPGGEKDGMSFQIGWIHLIGWLGALSLLIRFKQKDQKPKILIIFSSIFILLGIFMIHPRSEFIWKAIEPLKYLQFPWRFLILVIFFISFVAGSIFLHWNHYRQKILWAILFIAVIVFNFSYFRPEKFLDVTDGELLSGENWDRQIKRSIFDFLPTSAKAPPAELAKAPYEILFGEVEILDFKQGTNWISFRADTKGHSIIRLSQYYFPNWEVMVDGKKINVDYQNNNLGLMTLLLGEGRHQVEAKLLDTPIRALSNAVTVLGIIISLFFTLTQIPATRKWIFYYLKEFNR